MGHFDSYCFVCAGQAEIADALKTLFTDAALPASPNRLSDFHFDADDEAFQRDLVLIGPFDENGEQTIPIDDVELRATVDLSTVQMITDLVPGYLHNLGSVESKDDPEHILSIEPHSYPFGHALCFGLLAAFAPRVMHPPSQFWRTMCAINDVDDDSRVLSKVDYGDISLSLDQFVWPFYAYDECDGLPEPVLKALSGDHTEPSAIRQYWLDVGKMYVWVRPDKFPIKSALLCEWDLINFPDRSTGGTRPSFSSLPIDIFLAICDFSDPPTIVALLALSTSLRAKLVPAIDLLVRRALPEWALPADVEQDRWDAMLGDATGLPMGMNGFPWLSYARECYQNSSSMRNRERIWGICKQIDNLAVQHGIF